MKNVYHKKSEKKNSLCFAIIILLVVVKSLELLLKFRTTTTLFSMFVRSHLKPVLSRVIVQHSLLNLSTRIHDKGALCGNGLVERLSGQEQQLSIGRFGLKRHLGRRGEVLARRSVGERDEVRHDSYQ